VHDKLNKTWSLFTPTVTLLTEIGLLVVWIFGIWQISKGNSTVGVLTAFLAYISRFYTRLDSMSRIVSATPARRLQHQAHLRHSRSRFPAYPNQPTRCI
jgi:ATP-binding cassette subfamily B protein